MDLDSRKNAFVKLGLGLELGLQKLKGSSANSADSELNEFAQLLKEVIEKVHHHNSWFTANSVTEAVKAWSEALSLEKLNNWLEGKTFSDSMHKIGVIMAGNIPLVGLHDSLCTLISGKVLYAKLSSKDNLLMKVVLDFLANQSVFKDHIKLVERLNEIDALIATGSDNSSRYFDYYFRDKKKIIRKNRTSVSIIDGTESPSELKKLALDVFRYFGLGCRNVTKVYLPVDYDLDLLFNAFYDHKSIIDHHQYANNYDYNKAVYLLNKIELRENGFLLMKEDEGIHSPIGVLFYEHYNNDSELNGMISFHQENLQCIVGNHKLCNVSFGRTQNPELWDYADGINTLDFINSIN